MSDQDVQEQYEELVRFLAEPLLGTDDFNVESNIGRGEIKLRLLTPEDVRGRVIGKGGRIARSLRNILDAAAISDTLRTSLDIVD